MSSFTAEKIQTSSRAHMSRLLSYENLSVSEVNACILRFQRSADIPSRNKVIEHHQKVVAKVAHIYAKPGLLEFEDLIGYGNLGLIRAAEDFDVSKNNLFATYAWGWVHCYIREAIRDLSRTVRLPSSAQTKIRRGQPMRSTDLLSKVSTASIFSLGNETASDDRGIFGVTHQPEIVEERPDLPSLLASLDQYGLTKREVTYFRMHHGEGLDFKDIAKQLGVSRQAVNAGILKATSKIKAVLSPDSLDEAA